MNFSAMHFLLNKQQSNAFLGCFFREGKFSVEAFNNSCIIGFESDERYQYLKDLQTNFETLKNKKWNSLRYLGLYSKGGTWKCSNTCDYVYILEDCGAPVAGTQDCPWCKKKIMGSKHQGVQREGHENLSDEEAVAYLGKLVGKYES